MRSVAQLIDLTGGKALVTGGAGHLGLAVGEALVELGATVAVLDVDARACQERAEVLSQHVSARARGQGARATAHRSTRAMSKGAPDAIGGRGARAIATASQAARRSARRGRRAIAVPCDLTDEEATRGAVREAISKLGGLDILAHCAAYLGTTRMQGWAVPFDQQSVAAWDAAMRVNLTSAFVMAQEAKDALAASGRGSVMLFASIYGMVGPDQRLYEQTDMVNPAGYEASKGGLLQLTRYLATTLAPGIRVNAISPGGVWRDQPEVFQQRYVSRTPLGRMATEEDLKGAVAFLASGLSAYVTGQNLIVDGGWTAW